MTSSYSDLVLGLGEGLFEATLQLWLHITGPMSWRLPLTCRLRCFFVCVSFVSLSYEKNAGKEVARCLAVSRCSTVFVNIFYSS
jgi:hypothetical protein